MKKINSFVKTLKQQQVEQIKEKTSLSLEDFKKQQQEYNKLKQDYSSLKKQFETIKPEHEQLTKFKSEYEQNKKTTKIRSELTSTLKSLKVKDSALEDVLDLVSNKFSLSQDEKVFVAGKETDNDPTEFLTQFLKSKDHFLEAEQAPPAKIPPVQENQRKETAPQKPNSSLFGTSLFKK